MNVHSNLASPYKTFRIKASSKSETGKADSHKRCHLKRKITDDQLKLYPGTTTNQY